MSLRQKSIQNFPKNYNQQSSKYYLRFEAELIV